MSIVAEVLTGVGVGIVFFLLLVVFAALLDYYLPKD